MQSSGETLFHSPWLLIGGWLVSMTLVFFARVPIRSLLRSLTGALAGALRILSRWLLRTSADLRWRNRETLQQDALQETERTLDREFVRLEAGFAKHLKPYPQLHRRLQESVQAMETALAECADEPPAVPGWPQAIQAVGDGIAGLDQRGEKKLANNLQSVVARAEKNALKEYRDVSQKRHKVLSKTAGLWRSVKDTSSKLLRVVNATLETTTRVDQQMAKYERLSRRDPALTRSLITDAFSRFVIASLVIAVAIAGAFINFNLIALPMSELVPAGSRIGGVSVAKFAALTVVLMEITVGFFVMDALGITELLPKIRALPSGKRKLILAVGLTGMFFFACIETSLAVLREQIVEAEMLLQSTLAGAEAEVMSKPALSSIPVIGQAVLGFTLPWILMMVAMPLEMFINSSRQVAAEGLALLLSVLGAVCRALAQLVRGFCRALEAIFEIYIALPTALSRAFTKVRPAPAPRSELGPIPDSRAAQLVRSKAAIR